jgi:hypothetical protein
LTVGKGGVVVKRVIAKGALVSLLPNLVGYSLGDLRLGRNADRGAENYKKKPAQYTTGEDSPALSLLSA